MPTTNKRNTRNANKRDKARGNAVALVVRSQPRRDRRASQLGGVLGSTKATVAGPSLPMLNAITGSSSEPFRLPDSILEESVPLVLTNEYIITSDGAGYAVWAENHNLAAARLSWTVTAGVTGTGSGTVHPDSTAFAAGFPYARMLMYRVSVEYIGPEQTASGRIYCLHGSSYAIMDTQTLANIYDDANYTGKATDGYYDTVMFNQPPRYESPSTASFMQVTFPVRVLYAAGLPFNTPCFRVRVERFMEGLPGRDSLHRGSAQVEPYDAGIMEVVTNASHPNLHGGAMTNRPRIIENVWKAVKAAGALAWNNRAAIGQLAGGFSSTTAAKGALLALTAL